LTDSTILNVALPTLQKDLHASIAGLQWVSDAYLLVVASLLMLTGSTADRLGRKRLSPARTPGRARCPR
jgi:MFS family permease